MLESRKGLQKTNLYQFYSFYKCYPNIFHSNGKSFFLSWNYDKTLISTLMQPYCSGFSGSTLMGSGTGALSAFPTIDHLRFIVPFHDEADIAR